MDPLAPNVICQYGIIITEVRFITNRAWDVQVRLNVAVDRMAPCGCFTAKYQGTVLLFPFNDHLICRALELGS